MEYGTLNQRHPECTPELFARYDALYRGGQTFRGRVREFLEQNPLEASDVYAMRLKTAGYRSYVGPICDFFGAELFGAPFSIRSGTDGETEAPDAFYASFREDVDTTGTDLAGFLKARFLTALVKRSAWWVAELPDDGEMPPANRLEWETRNLGRARILPVEPDDVLDWEVDEAGVRQWAITHTKKVRRDNPREKRVLTTETWKLYDTTDVETFEITYDAKRRRLQEHDVIPSQGRRPHGFLRVPLVEMRLPEGLWLLDRASDAQIEHFRLSAALSWAIRRTCYPLGVFNSEDGTAPKTGPGLVTTIGKDEKFDWVSPPSDSFEVLQKEIDQQRTEIYRVCQQMAAAMNTSAAALDRSGDSKAADMAATEVCLVAYAAVVKGAAEDTFELVSDARGDVRVKFSVEGMSQFNLDNRTGEVNNCKVAHDLRIDSPTLNAELEYKVAELLLPDVSQQTKDKIREELLEASKKPKPAPVVAPPPGSPPQTSPAQPGADQKPQPTAA